MLEAGQQWQQAEAVGTQGCLPSFVTMPSLLSSFREGQEGGIIILYLPYTGRTRYNDIPLS